MKNFEKYYDEITDKTFSYEQLIINLYCKYNNKDSALLENALRWLFKSESILTDKEKGYLENVVKPFKNKIVYIKKRISSNNKFEWIQIAYDDNSMNMCDYLTFPSFNKNTIYKGMEIDKEYTLEELGLFKEE